MRIIIVVFAIVAFCAANQTESKEKRQIHYTSVPTQLRQLSHGYQGEQQQAPQFQQYHSGTSNDQQPTPAQLEASGEEIPPEYYNAIKEFAEKQAEIIQRQQLEVGMKDLIQRVGGRVEIKKYEVPYDPKNPGATVIPQTSESSKSFGKDQEPLVIDRPVEYVRLQPGHPGSTPSGESDEAKPQYARLSAPQLQQPKYGFSPEQVSYDGGNRGQQQVQYSHVPQGQHYSSFSGHPLAGSTLEKEIAKLESSFQSHIKGQPQPEQLGPQAQALRFKAQPHQHQFQVNQNQFAYIAPGVSKYQTLDNYKNQAQPTPLTLPNNGQYASTGHLEGQVGKNQYTSEVHRFYNQPPKPIHQQQSPEAHYYAAQQNPNKIQYVTTDKPVQEEQEPTPKYDTSGTMKIIPAPQLQYGRPSKYQQPQPIAAYYNQYKLKSTPQLQGVGQQNLFKPAVHGAEVAPSRSSIFVSQSTGAPSPPQYNKPQVQAHQAYQYPNFHRQNTQEQIQKQTQNQDHQEVRLPPPNGGRPLTQKEFQALVDAGYSVTAIPVPVPVSAEQYHKHQQNQRYQSLNLQHETPNLSYDNSNEQQGTRSHGSRLIKY